MDNKFKNVGVIKVEKTDAQRLNPVYKKDYDGDEDFDDDKSYDDTMQDQETGDDVTKIEYRRKLLEIPAEMLPCPNKLSYEASYSPPTQDEVKYYKTSSSDTVRSYCWVTLVILINIL
jgi:hypothetical protein